VSTFPEAGTDSKQLKKIRFFQHLKAKAISKRGKIQAAVPIHSNANKMKNMVKSIIILAIAISRWVDR
jgi:hypothetical protein